MYGKNNEEAEEIASILLEMENRIMHACPVSADSLYDALLYQISHKKEQYKAFEMLKQFAYYLCKHLEIFKDIVEDHLKEGESYESFVLNMFQGLSYPNVDVVCATVAKMWNTPVTVVSPRGVKQKFHDLDDADNLIVIVWNGSEGVDCQYTATKPNFIEWRPIKPLDWSAPVKIVNNVKSANELAEKLFRKRRSDQIKKEYKRCSEVIIYMKEKLVKMNNQVIVMENQLDSMKTTIKICTADIYKVEKTQTRLLNELTNLGVKVESFAKPGQKIVPGFQQLPHNTAKASTTRGDGSRIIDPSIQPSICLNPFVKLKRVQIVGKPILDVQSTDKELTPAEQTPAEQTLAEQIPVEQTMDEQESQLLQQLITDQQEVQQSNPDQQELMDTGDVDSTAKTSGISVTDVITPDLSVVKSQPPHNPNSTLWLPPPAAASGSATASSNPPTFITPIYPYGGVSQQSASSVATTQATPQMDQIAVSVAPKTVASTITPEGKSTRWGRVLKGQHSFVCARCHRPFTTKSDTVCHYESNCPMLPPSMKKKYTCDHCGESKFRGKQYLKEHIYEKHKQEFLYFCKSCGKGYYKHCIKFPQKKLFSLPKGCQSVNL